VSEDTPWVEQDWGTWTASWEIDGIGRATACVDATAGARLSSFSVGGVEFLGESSSPRTRYEFRSGCFPMAPYAGRVGGGTFTWHGQEHSLPLSAPPHAAHGLVADAPWSGDGTGAFERALDSRWPFGGRVTQRIRCTSNGIVLRLTIINDDNEMPASLGFHPWFRRRIGDSDVELVLDPPLPEHSDGELGSRMLLPAGTDGSSWCVPAFLKPPILRWGDGLSLTLDSDAAFWVVYAGDAGAVCVEPQTSPPNALQVGDCATVSPGHPLSLELRMTPSMHALSHRSEP
jgi:aldose 1-epimerase